jgi:hypothetical protein
MSILEKQVLEDRPAFSVYTGNLAVDYSVLHLQMFGEPGSEFGKTPKDIPIAGNQFAFEVGNVGQRTESVDLQLVKKVVGVEGFRPAGEPDRAKLDTNTKRIIAQFSFLVLRSMPLRAGW